MLKRICLWTLLSASIAATVLAQTPKDRLTLDLYLELETVSDPRQSPDATQVIYTRGSIDKINDKHESALWIMNADGGKNRFLVELGPD